MQASTRPSPASVPAQCCFTSAAQAFGIHSLEHHRLAALGQILEVRLEATCPKCHAAGVTIRAANMSEWIPLAIPQIQTGFSILMLGYLVLLAGNVFRGL